MADTGSVTSTQPSGTSSGLLQLPLTLLDEGLLHFQDARAQWNVQLELGTDHHVDEAAFRRAVLNCCRRHPLVRARIAPWKQTENSYAWHVGDELDVDPVQVLDCPDDAALERIRADLYRPEIPLSSTPGLRIVLARRPGGDQVLLNTSHLVADGIGAVRLMQTITREYRGEPDPPDPVPLDEARDLAAYLAPKNRSERWARSMEPLRRIREAIDSPSRIAVVGGVAGDDFGFVCRAFDIGASTTPALLQRESGTTINDVLLAVLHLTVQAWNTEHGMETDRVGSLMPVNVRPAERFWEVVSNITSMATVSTSPEDRSDLPTATAAVAAQTDELRRQDRAHGLYDLLVATRKAPIFLKRAAPKLLPHVGDRFIDTAMLSNLGRIPDPPTFGEDPARRPPELWFSPPCDPACSVAIGVATVGDRLNLVTRYRYEQFDPAAAGEFTDLLIAHLEGKRNRPPDR